MPVFRENPKPPDESCPKCGSVISYVIDRWDEWKRPKCRRCECQEIKSWIRAQANEVLTARGCPKRYYAARLEQFGKGYPKAVGQRGLFIEGPRGVGKTHLAAALMWAEIETWEPMEIEPERNEVNIHHHYFHPKDDHCHRRYDDFPLFVSASELLLQIRSTFNRHEGEAEHGILEKYSSAPVLFIDDLGAENPTAWAGAARARLLGAGWC
jgi:hypothetical protein